MIRYVFADQRVLAIKNASKADPQKLGEAIQKIASRNNGQIEPDMLWKDAKDNPKHPAYKHFEWDVQRAAEAHWTSTARRLIRAIVPLDDEGHEMPIPAFISVNAGGGTSYRTSQEVMDSPQLRKLVLEQAERDLLAFQQRHRRFAELFQSLEEPIRTTRRLRGEDKTDRPGK
jgi:hypothetical protein